MNSKSGWGHMERWLIHKRGNQWHIVPPGSLMSGWRFPTGAEALTAFAKGE